jgi:hypothetical protein
MNKGEQNEVLLKAFFVKCLFEKTELTGAPKEISKIKNILFGPKENAPEWKEKYNSYIKNRDYEKLAEIFKKAKSGFKADIQINGVNYSVKYKDAAKTALLNHTHRGGVLKVYERNNWNIEKLDDIVSQYWKLRESGLITEDIKNSNPNSPFNKNKELIKELLKYFLFKGTASGDSIFPADKILEFNNPLDPTTYKIIEPETAVNELWPSLVFSIRNKAMPKNYNEEDNKDLTPWVRFSSGKYRGSLHIRS